MTGRGGRPAGRFDAVLSADRVKALKPRRSPTTWSPGRSRSTRTTTAWPQPMPGTSPELLAAGCAAAFVSRPVRAPPPRRSTRHQRGRPRRGRRADHPGRGPSRVGISPRRARIAPGRAPDHLPRHSGVRAARRPSAGGHGAEIAGEEHEWWRSGPCHTVMTRPIGACGRR